MDGASIVTVQCDYCGEPIRKGDEFVVFGKYLGIYHSWLRARYTGIGTLPEDFGEIFHPACYMKSQKERKAEQEKVVKL